MTLLLSVLSEGNDFLVKMATSQTTNMPLTPEKHQISQWGGIATPAAL
jgi:hypothetical protein